MTTKAMHLTARLFEHYAWSMRERLHVQWSTSDGLLRAFEPNSAEVGQCAKRLSDAYNEPYNRAMMAHDADSTPEEVVDIYSNMWKKEGRPFLLFRNSEWVGDADFRHIHQERAEFAIMVGPRVSQGKGLGTRFSLMLHSLAFRMMNLEQVFATILPMNGASLRLFDKLGYIIDNSPDARAFADAPDDVSLSITRQRFNQIHAEALSEIACSRRQDDQP